MKHCHWLQIVEAIDISNAIICHSNTSILKACKMFWYAYTAKIVQVISKEQVWKYQTLSKICKSTFIGKGHCMSST